MEAGASTDRPLAAYSPEQHRPLAAYAVLSGIYGTGVGAFALAQRRSRRALPERVPLGDFLLLAVATQKLSRQIAKDRVTAFARAPFTRYTGEAGPGEVSEEPRGTGMQLAVGELLECPYCVGQWVASAFVGTYIRNPRAARAIATVFGVLSAADFLQLAYVAAQEKA